MKTQTNNTRERSSPGIFQTSDLFHQPNLFRVLPKTPIGPQITDQQANQENVRLYDFMYKNAHDLGRYSDVDGLHHQYPTVRSSKHETPTIDQDNLPALHSNSATLTPNQNPKIKMQAEKVIIRMH
jgi:hypothetical protein